MNKISKLPLKPFVAVLVITSFLLASCANLDQYFPVTVCHATDDSENPYSEVSVATPEELLGHRNHNNDLFPVPANGCPTVPVEVENNTINICHATGNDDNPYNEITISVDGLDDHAEHEDDIFPVPEDGCPTEPLEINDGKITICHATNSAKNPYNEITISVNGLNGHGKHEDDIIPMPEEGCPTTAVNAKTNNGQQKK